MNPRASTWFPLVLMLLLAALTYWLQLTISETGPARRRASDSTPDSIVENLRVTRTAASGLPDYVLTGVRMEHFRTSDTMQDGKPVRGLETTQVTKPSLTHYAPGAPPVRLDAERGVAVGNGDLYEFFDKVVVTRAAVAGNPELVMRTEYLKVQPDRALASTDRPVTITQGDSILTGTGLELDNNARILRLLSQVHGTFIRAAKK